jgi:hypothetical protein
VAAHQGASRKLGTVRARAWGREPTTIVWTAPHARREAELVARAPWRACDDHPGAARLTDVAQEDAPVEHVEPLPTPHAREQKGDGEHDEPGEPVTVAAPIAARSQSTATPPTPRGGGVAEASFLKESERVAVA